MNDTHTLLYVQLLSLHIGRYMIDLRFSTALQLMLSLALAEDQGIARLSSGDLADGLGVASSFVRKLMMPLTRDALLVSSMGKLGGVSLGCPAAAISLADIYRCVTEEKPLLQSRPDVPHRCVVSTNIEVFFEQIADEASNAVLAVLGRRTLADSLAQLRRIDAGLVPALTR